MVYSMERTIGNWNNAGYTRKTTKSGLQNRHKSTSKVKTQAHTYWHTHIHTHAVTRTNTRTQMNFKEEETSTNAHTQTQMHAHTHTQTHKHAHTSPNTHTHTSTQEKYTQRPAHTQASTHTHISRAWISPVPYLNTGREESSRHRWTLEWLISKWYSSECTWRPHEGRCPQQEQSGRNQQWRMSTRSAAKDRSTTDSTISWHLPLCLRYQSCYINSRIQAHY